MTQFDLDSIDRLLTTTKAVRRRLDLTRPVPREVVADCIRLGCYAPNASNAQEWFWVVVDDAEQRRKVTQIYRDVLVPRVSQMLEAKLAMGDEAGARISRSILYLADCMQEVPVLVIPCYDVGAALHRYNVMIPEPGPLGLSTHMDSGMFASVIPAVWSFQLALRSRGLGSCFTTLHLAHEREAGELLGIPDTVTQAALIPVVYTKGEEFKPAARRPVEEITYWNRWKQMS